MEHSGVGGGLVGLRFDLLVEYVHLEDFRFVVRIHAAVEEVLGQREVDHAVVLPDHRVHGVVHQRAVRVRQGEEHPLHRGHKRYPPPHTRRPRDLSSEWASDPEVHVEAPGRHYWVVDQSVINTDELIDLRPHGDRLQHRVHVDQRGVIQSGTDLRDRRREIDR